jgi:hypothetical protein
MKDKIQKTLDMHHSRMLRVLAGVETLKEAEEETSKDLQALFLSELEGVIGQDEKPEILTSDYPVSYTLKNFHRNELRAEQRKRLILEERTK